MVPMGLHSVVRLCRKWLDILKWLREQGCPFTGACESAAKGGHLEVLKWLKENGCEFDEYTFLGAAQGGHLQIMKWLRCVC